MEALKANELRIGNLVGLEDSEWNGFNQFFEFMENSEVKSFLDDRNKYAIVKTIADEVELMAYGVDLDFYSYKEIQPIPLTEDWLIRLGFEKLMPNIEDEIKDELRTVIIFRKIPFTFNTSNGWWLNSSKINIQPDYVHQLQNLYFALTGSELTLKN